MPFKLTLRAYSMDITKTNRITELLDHDNALSLITLDQMSTGFEDQGLTQVPDNAYPEGSASTSAPASTAPVDSSSGTESKTFVATVTRPPPASNVIVFDSIAVHSPEVRKENPFTRYHTYKITTVPAVVNHVYRRYNEFVWLQESLASLYPGIFIPALPPKRRFNNMDENFVADERRPGLERFLNRIRMIPILAESLPFQLFLSRDTDFESAQKEVKRMVNNNSSGACLNSFKHYYPAVVAEPLRPTAHHDVANLDEFLASENTHLSKLVETADSIIKATSEFVEQTSKLNSNLSKLYDVEKGFLALPGPQRCTALEAFHLWGKELKELEPYYTNSLLLALQWELQDVREMQRVLSARDAIRKSAEKARKTADKWRAPDAKCDTEKLRISRENDLKTEEEENAMLDAVTKLILYDQHRQCWMTRVTDWSKAVGSFATGQASFNQRAYNSWVALLAPPQDQQ